MVWLKAYSVSVESVSNWIVIALIVLCVIWVDLLLTIWCLADRKSTKVQTLGELRMRDTANWWAGLLICVYSWSPASSPRRVWHGLATVVDSMRESIPCPSLWLLVPSRYTERASECARGKPVLIGIFAFSLVFHAVTLDRSCFRENPTYFDLYPTLNTWYCLWSDSYGSWSEMLGNGQTDTNTTTVTIAVHARQGLTILKTIFYALILRVHIPRII